MDTPLELDPRDRPPLRLVGESGNAFAIIGRASNALRAAGRQEDIPRFQTEAKSGDYDHLLQTCLRWFNVDDADIDED
jgi:hypothetical protein